MSASCIVLSHVRVSLFFGTDETCCVDPIRSSEFLSALSQMLKSTEVRTCLLCTQVCHSGISANRLQLL